MLKCLLSSPQLWSHLPLSPSATIQQSGAPPSRERYSQQEFVHLAMAEAADEDAAASETEQVSFSRWMGGCGILPSLLGMTASLSH